MNLDFARAYEMKKRLIDAIAECQVMNKLLLHHDYLIGEKRDIF
jgi:hypothetical protein